MHLRSKFYTALQYYYGGNKKKKRKNKSKNLDLDRHIKGLYSSKQSFLSLTPSTSSTEPQSLKSTGLRKLKAFDPPLPHVIVTFEPGSNSNCQFRFWAVSLLIQNMSLAWQELLSKNTGKYYLEYYYKYSQKYFHQHKRLKISLRLQFP